MMSMNTTTAMKSITRIAMEIHGSMMNIMRRETMMPMNMLMDLSMKKGNMS